MSLNNIFQTLDWLFTCLFCWSSSTGRYFIRLCNRLHTPQCLFGIPIMEILPRCKQLHIKKIISIQPGTLTLAYDSNVYQSKGAQSERNTYWIKLKVIMILCKKFVFIFKNLASQCWLQNHWGQAGLRSIEFHSSALGYLFLCLKQGHFISDFFK